MGYNATRDKAVIATIKEWEQQQGVKITDRQRFALADKFFVKCCARCEDPEEGFKEVHSGHRP